MESVKRLEAAAKDVLKDIKSSAFSEIALQGQVEKLKKQREDLNGEISALNDTKAKVSSSIQEQKKAQDEALNKKSDELKVREGQLNERLAINAGKTSELDRAKAAADKEHKQYIELRDEYVAKIADINERLKLFQAAAR